MAKPMFPLTVPFIGNSVLVLYPYHLLFIVAWFALTCYVVYVAVNLLL
jgi:hypothetical protein